MLRTEQLLAELIALPSVNPAFLPLRHPQAGEKRVADFLAATAAQAGLDVEFQKALPGRSNVIARFSPRGKIQQTIVLAPHMDTVGADGTKFIPQRKNGRLYGRGACDTKGSVAAMLAAVCELAKSKARPLTTEIIFVGLIDEEHMQAGSRALVAGPVWSSALRRPGKVTHQPGRLQAELQTGILAIVGEPTKLQVVTAHKGSLWLNLATRGRSAHGATPHLGINAVHTMSRVLDALENEYGATLKKRKHKLLGRATVNVGKISGGSQPNIVPDECVIEIDRRTLPGETERSVLREIASLLETNDLSATVSSAKLAPAEPLETDVRLPLVQQFMRSVKQSRPVGVDYFCDASVFSAAGIPSVVFGPGDIAQAHTTDEWISLAELERAKNLLVRFFLTLP